MKNIKPTEEALLKKMQIEYKYLKEQKRAGIEAIQSIL